MGALSNLQPESVFKYFDQICSIPHGSGNTNAIAQYCTDFAEVRNLKWYRDPADNVIIYKPAYKGYENAEKMILQGHSDMVCEKNEDVDFDFEKDGVKAYVDGDFIRATGTTLGGDNGIAVAMMLAVLDDKELPHPALEVLITADEEIGMVGAFALDCSKLEGHKLLNLDSEAEGVLMCSCAGGLDAESVILVNREEKELQLIEIEIAGLVSGHSGVEIDKGRANSNVLIGRMLYELEKGFEIHIHSLEGGSRNTAIAASSCAIIGVEKKDVEAVITATKKLGETYKQEYLSTEEEMKVVVTQGKCATTSVLTTENTGIVCRVLMAIPDSVQEMSADMPGLVQTSTNFGILKLTEDKLTFVNTIRSSMTTQKRMVLDKIKAIVTLAGGTTIEKGSYPGWAYNPNSNLQKVIINSYEKITGKKPTIEAVHAGIECGLFADSIENLDCVSLGPDMGDVHTPNEYLSISSSGRVFDLLKMVLEDSK